MKKHKINTAVFLIISAVLLAAVGLTVFRVDPYFHFRKPDTEQWFYQLTTADERFQNNGILRQFDYDAVITGTSMSECFRTSELDKMFGTSAVKVPYYGSTFKETHDQLQLALEGNDNIRMVVRDLEMRRLMDDKEEMTYPAGSYPDYLYDDDPLNDVEYLFNRNVIFERTFSMILNEEETGITSFDDYANWSSVFTYGVGTVKPLEIEEIKTGEGLTDEEKETVLENIRANVTSLAEEYPDVDFYLFFPPYSIVWWQTRIYDGTIYKIHEAEQIAIEELLKYENIKLFSFNDRTEVTTDLNNYEDYIHYGEWVNLMILKYMQTGEGLLTYDNYQDYLDEEMDFYLSYDYASLKDQTDYEDDQIAAVRMDEVVTGNPPVELDNEIKDGELRHAKVTTGYDGASGLNCKGRLDLEYQSDISLEDYLYETDYVGCRFTLDDVSEYRHLSFWGKKKKDQGMPAVFIYDSAGNVKQRFMMHYEEIDRKWHHYTISLYGIDGPVTVILNGGYIDDTGSEESDYVFSRVMLS